MLAQAGVGFNESRCKLVAKAFEEGDNHVRAVLTGAANSSAVYQVISYGHTKVGCEWCQQDDVVSSWYHLGWECSFFMATRPVWGGMDVLQLRLGWPSGSANDAVALRHLATTRSAVLATVLQLLTESLPKRRKRRKRKAGRRCCCPRAQYRENNTDHSDHQDDVEANEASFSVGSSSRSILSVLSSCRG